MRFRLATTVLLVIGLAVAAVSVSATTTTTPAKAADTWPIDTYGTPRATDNAILKWDEQLLSVIRAYPPQTGPTITARALGVLHTATYDAWAAYDPTAKVTRPDGPAQQKPALNNTANKAKAISYAAYRVMLDLFPPSAYPAKGAYKTPDVLLSSQLYDPSYSTVASTTDTAADPAAVGNRAALAVTTYRHNDGSNQLNNYGDTTGYQPFNQWNNIRDRWRWAPLCVLTPAGVTAKQPVTRDPTLPCPDTSPPTNYSLQRAATPQWGKVTMFSPLPASSVPGDRAAQERRRQLVYRRHPDRPGSRRATSPTPRRPRPSTGPTAPPRSSRPGTRPCSPRRSHARTATAWTPTSSCSS